MNKFHLTFRPSQIGDSKIADIKAFRELTRNPFTGDCATLSSAKIIVESIYDSGNEDFKVEVTPEEAAIILSNWTNPECCPDGWYLEKSEPVKVEPPVPSIDYYSQT